MQRIAIIGAGASGLVSAAAALKEGLQPFVLEQSGRIGGVWAPDNSGPADHGSAWPRMRTNISRRTGSFFYSWPDDTPDFPTTQQMYDYLHGYADKFNLLPHIHFGCKVIQVFKQDEKWVVCWEKNNIITRETFDGIIVATSKFSNPFIPEFEGLKNLTGKMLHSARYRSAHEYIGRKVLVVGGSLSGTAIAEELAAKTEVIHLLRKARWVIKRYRSSDPKKNGPLLPRDLLKTYAQSLHPPSKEEEYQKMLLHCPEQNAFPEWRMSPDSPVGFVVADNYFEKVRSGRITPVKGEIASFTGSNVLLKDGRHFDFDAVIFCTGYFRDLSYLPENLRSTANLGLYEDTISPAASGLAYIGMYLGARGAVFPLIELQAEFACRVFNGKIKLPPPEVMRAEIAGTPTDRNEIEFLNSLARKLGAFPDPDLFNPSLRHMLMDGAFTSARFRLVGPLSEYESAVKQIEQTEMYRRKLLRSKDKICSLAERCLFVLGPKAKEISNQDGNDSCQTQPKLS